MKKKKTPSKAEKAKIKKKAEESLLMERPNPPHKLGMELFLENLEQGGEFFKEEPKSAVVAIVSMRNNECDGPEWYPPAKFTTFNHENPVAFMAEFMQQEEDEVYVAVGNELYHETFCEMCEEVQLSPGMTECPHCKAPVLQDVEKERTRVRWQRCARETWNKHAPDGDYIIFRATTFSPHPGRGLFWELMITLTFQDHDEFQAANENVSFNLH